MQYKFICFRSTETGKFYFGEVLEIYEKIIRTISDWLIHLQLPKKFTRSEQLQLKCTPQDIKLTSNKVEEAKDESLEQQKQKR